MIYALLALAASTYAYLLSTPPGREFADKHTVESVVIGVSLVLAALRFVLPASAFRAVVMAFAVAGLPLVARSLIKRRVGVWFPLQTAARDV